MSITRNAVPLILASTLLTGCAGLQKTDWPTCAAVGGVGGAALGAIESSSWAGAGAALGAGLGAAYCWVHGAEAQQVAVVEEVVVEEVAVAEPAEAVRVELDVKFDFDKAQVKQESYGDIKALAEPVLDHPCA